MVNFDFDINKYYYFNNICKNVCEDGKEAADICKKLEIKHIHGITFKDMAKNYPVGFTGNIFRLIKIIIWMFGRLVKLL